jgi:thioredoxin reductase (NADPH)
MRGIKLSEYDVIIIGAGPAGLTCGMYTARRRLKTLILETQPGVGGRAITAHKIENYPGFPEGISGIDLTNLMKQQTLKWDVELKEMEEVIKLNFNEKKFVQTRKETYEGKAVVLAIGAKHGKLNIKVEDRLLGRGVSYCATCDGPFFRKQIVAVIGSENEAVEEAAYLTDLAEKVYLISPEGNINADDILLDLLNKSKAEILLNKEIKEIQGKEEVTTILLQDKNTRQEQTIQISGVFIALGAVPITTIVQQAGIKLDEKGNISTNKYQETNIEGVFACGDCCSEVKQIVTATGTGAIAGVHAAKYVKEKK